MLYFVKNNLHFLMFLYFEYKNLSKDLKVEENLLRLTLRGYEVRVESLNPLFMNLFQEK